MSHRRADEPPDSFAGRTGSDAAACAMTPSRLLPRDDWGVRTDRLLGAPSVLALGWYFEAAIDPAVLSEMRDRLMRGPLSRVVKRIRIPGARDRWAQSPAAGAMSYSAEPIKAGHVFDWLEEQRGAPLDLCQGPVWRLTATTVEGGHTVVLLLVHHAVADGHGLINAWAAAAEDRVVGELVDDGGLAADLMDGLRQWRGAAIGAGKLARARSRRKAEGRAESPAAARQATTAGDLDHEPSPSPTFFPRQAYLEFAPDEFRRAAAERGGTVNSLFMGIGARLLVASGVIPEGRTVEVSQRVSERAEGDYRGNVISGASFFVDVGPSLYEDLRPIRAASKEALRQRATGEHNFAELDSPLIQAIPDWLFARRFGRRPKNPSRALCTASNITVPADAVAVLDGKRARSFYPSFALPKQDEAELWRRYSSAIQVVLLDVGEEMTLMVEGRNPERHAVCHEEFVVSLVEECRRWGLTPLRAL
ncbi:MAG: hypothetical protein ACRC20_05140 [Segniliparus sp.]|uniref:hypothetical protein n=1 Tax=Segniliparus sp. TaxID=2804064 RepID=UPI003F2E1826